MDYEKIVCSLELAQKLDDLKTAIKSTFRWYSHSESDTVFVDDFATKTTEDLDALCAAPTSEEIGDLIPGNIDGMYFVTQKGLLGNRYYCMAKSMTTHKKIKEFESKKKVDVEAKMLIYLLENHRG